jgi:molecular chaperone DnaJ
MQQDKDHYGILGISRDASDSDIKQAYRKLVLQHHPDAGGSAVEFRKVAEAYEVLSNPEKKQAYDSYGSADRNMMGNGFGGGDFNDLFAHFGFSGFRRTAPGPVRAKGANVRITVQVELEELCQKELKRELEYTRQGRCFLCNSTGLKAGKTQIACHICNGIGVFVKRSVRGNMIEQPNTHCPSCNGTGKQINEEDKCEQCHGCGTIDEQQRVEIIIPKGIGNGATVPCYGHGSCGFNDGPNGDLLVSVYFTAHNVFSVYGSNVNLEYKISVLQAITGCQVELPTIHGNTVILDIPPGIEHGNNFVKYGYGIPGGNGQNGDMVIVVNIDIPKNMSEQQKIDIGNTGLFVMSDSLSDNIGMYDYLKRIKHV